MKSHIRILDSECNPQGSSFFFFGLSIAFAYADYIIYRLLLALFLITLLLFSFGSIKSNILPYKSSKTGRSTVNILNRSSDKIYVSANHFFVISPKIISEKKKAHSSTCLISNTFIGFKIDEL